MKKHPNSNRPQKMTWSSDRECCDRLPNDKEIAVADAGFDIVETAVLEVARYYWQTFAQPDTQSWFYALQRAEHSFGGGRGGEIGLEILAAVQAMRMIRMSCFRFNNPTCPGCSAIMSEHERQFMNVFRAMRDGRPGLARTHAMLLCEGNDTDPLIDRMGELVLTTYGKHTEPRSSSVAAQHLH